MGWSFPVGRLLGSELRIHATFFLLLLWIGGATYAQSGAKAAYLSIAFILVLFACVVAHEYGHALMARRYGIKTPDITLLPIGGLARLERIPEKPSEEIAVALAGPAVNVVIWAVLSLFVGTGSDLDSLSDIGGLGQQFWAQVATLNLILAVFNMLPAFPMDGGRVLRAVLSLTTDRVRATRLAARAGQLLAFILGFIGLSTGNFMLLLVAFFVFVAAGAESNDVAMRDLARRFMARETMITQYESLMPDDPLNAAAQGLIRTTQHEFPVLDSDGHVAGMLTRAAIFQAVAGGQETGRVSDYMVTDIPAVSLTTGLEKVFEDLHRADVPAVAVTDAAGRMLGYITRENIGEMMAVSARRPA